MARAAARRGAVAPALSGRETWVRRNGRLRPERGGEGETEGWRCQQASYSPDRVEYDGLAGRVVGSQGRELVVEAFGSDGAHVDDEGAAQPRQVGRLPAVVGHDRRRAD